MSWLIIWLVLCVMVGASTLAFRRIRRKRITIIGGGSRASSAPEPTTWTWVERFSWLFGIVSGAAAVWTLVPSVAGTSQAGSLTPTSSAESEVLLRRDEFPLGPPSGFPREETDKIDLDTGERGHGKIVEDSGVDLQPDGGGRADLVIEETSVHAFSDGDRSLAVLKAGEPTTYASCSGVLADGSRRVARISLDDIDPDSRLCVRTDKGRVALVMVLRESEGPILTIAYTTWSSAGAAHLK
jgi:hypothetical protein